MQSTKWSLQFERIMTVWGGGGLTWLELPPQPGLRGCPPWFGRTPRWLPGTSLLPQGHEFPSPTTRHKHGIQNLMEFGNSRTLCQNVWHAFLLFNHENYIKQLIDFPCSRYLVISSTNVYLLEMMRILVLRHLKIMPLILEMWTIDLDFLTYIFMIPTHMQHFFCVSFSRHISICNYRINNAENIYSLNSSFTRALPVLNIPVYCCTSVGP